MASSFERFRKDIDRLVDTGELLAAALSFELNPEQLKKLPKESREKVPNLRLEYEGWYSEAIPLVKLLLPDRFDDFIAYYKPKHSRKIIDASNYTISDYLRGIGRKNSYGETIVGPESAYTPLRQQVKIVETLRRRFESSLFDIRTLVHADILDDELHAAEELNNKGFQRGAGAVAGVVLEGHLSAVCDRHGVKLGKKDPSIGDLNDALKNASVLEIPDWRFIQRLGDIRNKCDHKKAADPSKAEVDELIDGEAMISRWLRRIVSWEREVRAVGKSTGPCVPIGLERLRDPNRCGWRANRIS